MPVGAVGAATFQAQAARAAGRLHRMSKAIGDTRARGSLAYLGETLVNYAKAKNRPGRWQDGTTSLTRSITWVILSPEQSVAVPYQTAKGSVKTNVVNDTDQLMLVVFAGMEYAVYVEFKPGYNVLSGAVEKYRPLAADLLGKKFVLRQSDAWT